MKKTAAALLLAFLAVPALAAADDDAILSLLQALQEPAPVHAVVVASSTPAAPVSVTSASGIIVPAKPVQTSPDIIPPTLAPGYVFNIDGNAPKSSQGNSQSDAQAAQLKAVLASLVSQLALLSHKTAAASSTPAASSTASAAVKKPAYPRNLALGAKGADVTALQQLLIGGGYMAGDATGYFGILTQTAVIALQTDQGLDATGFVGPKTRALLNANDPKTFVHAVPSNADPLTDSTKVILVQTTQPAASSTDATSTAATSSEPTATSTPAVPGSAATSSAATSSPAVLPVTVNFSVSPVTVPLNGKSVATWSSLNATSCLASGDWNGALPLFGTAIVGPVHAAIDLVLTCSGAGGDASSTATIVLNGDQ